MVNYEEQIKKPALQLADIFTEHSHTVGVASDDQIGPSFSYVTDEGMELLGDTFEKVPVELRAAVYSDFLDELARRGLNYDINQFNTPPKTVH